MPDDFLTILQMALSIVLRDSAFLLSFIQATRFLAASSMGLLRIEYICVSLFTGHA